MRLDGCIFRLSCRRFLLCLQHLLLIGIRLGIDILNGICRSCNIVRSLLDQRIHFILLRFHICPQYFQLVHLCFQLYLRFRDVMLILHVFVQHLTIVRRQVLDIIRKIQKLRKCLRGKQDVHIPHPAVFIKKADPLLHALVLLLTGDLGLLQLHIGLIDLNLLDVDLHFQLVQIIRYQLQFGVQLVHLALITALDLLQSCQAGLCLLQILLCLCQFAFLFLLAAFRLIQLFLCGRGGLHRMLKHTENQHCRQQDAEYAPASRLFWFLFYFHSTCVFLQSCRWAGIYNTAPPLH